MGNEATEMQTTRTQTATLALVAVLALTATLLAQERKVTQPRAGAPGQWRVIGQLEAGFKADHDELIVKGPFDDFRKIKFAVTGADLNLQRLLITYENGVPDEIPVRQSIREGGESRQIDLKGAGKRRIRKIAFWYDTKGILKGRAKVTVFGMK
jgi:hypothetical protein